MASRYRPVLPVVAAGLAVGMLLPGPLWVWWVVTGLGLAGAMGQRTRLVAVALLAGVTGWLVTPRPMPLATPALWQGSGVVDSVRSQVWRQSAWVDLDQPLADGRRRLLVRLPLLPAVALGDRLRLAGSLVAERWRSGPQVVARITNFRVHSPRGVGELGRAWQAVDQLGSHRELGYALLLGRGTPPERDGFLHAGLLHVLAVSGLHLGLALVALGWVLRVGGMSWALRQTCLLVAGGCYLLLTGMAIPTQRALIMVAASQLARLGGRRPHPLAPWGLACLVLVVLHPWAVAGPGFQLSIAAVGGIVTMGRDLVRMRKAACPLQPWPLDRLLWRWLLIGARWSADGLAIGLAASVAVTPILAWHFQAVQPWSPVASLIATPPLVVALGAGLALVIATSLWPSGPWQGLVVLTDTGLASLVAIADQAAAWPGATVVTTSPPTWVMIGWALLFLPMRDRWDLLTRSLALVALVWGWAFA